MIKKAKKKKKEKKNGRFALTWNASATGHFSVRAAS